MADADMAEAVENAPRSEIRSRGSPHPDISADPQTRIGGVAAPSMARTPLAGLRPAREPHTKWPRADDAKPNH
jgi:hypothetical protein